MLLFICVTIAKLVSRLCVCAGKLLLIPRCSLLTVMAVFLGEDKKMLNYFWICPKQPKSIKVCRRAICKSGVVGRSIIFRLKVLPDFLFSALVLTVLTVPGCVENSIICFHLARNVNTNIQVSNTSVDTFHVYTTSAGQLPAILALTLWWM